MNSAALTLLVVISQKFEDTAKKLTVVKNSLWKITGDTYPAMFFNYLLEASILVVPFEALWADMSGHNTLAMTNNQTFGPFGWICWILVIPYHRWCAEVQWFWNYNTGTWLEHTFVNCANHFYITGESSISGKLESVNCCFVLGGQFLRLTDDGSNTPETGLKLEWYCNIGFVLCASHSGFDFVQCLILNISEFCSLDPLGRDFSKIRGYS